MLTTFFPFLVSGLNPIPAALSAPAGSTGTHRGSWWGHIQPAEGSYEQDWHRTQCVGAEAAGMPPDWTVYDAKKLQLGLKIVSHAAVLLRLVSSPQVVRRHRDLQAVNANAAAEAFCRCAMLSQQLSTASSSLPASRGVLDGAAGDKILERAAGLVGLPFGAAAGTPGRSTAAASVDWLRSPLAVSAPFSRFAAEHNPLSPAPRSAATTATTATTAAAAAAVSAVGGFNVDATSARGESGGTAEQDAGRLAVAETLLVVAENLVCVVHSLAQLQALHPVTTRASTNNGGSGESAAGASVLSAEATQKALEAAAAFPPHSFIRQVARWIQDLAHH